MSSHATAVRSAASVEGAALSVVGLAKSYGSGEHAVHTLEDVSFAVQGGELVCVVGPSGCGKTTMLKCMAGLQGADRGTVTIDGRAVSEPPPDMAVVFQEYTRSLFPWLTVKRNVMFALREKLRDRRRREEVASEALASVGLEGFENHHPWQLSGGMQQRVAIARALAYAPRVLLMDEPFASVDAQTRAELEDLTLRIQAESGVTIVFITHDIDESVYLSDRVVVLTSRPTTVQQDIVVDLPRPRDQVATKSLARYSALRAEIYEAIRASAAAGGRESPGGAAAATDHDGRGGQR